MYSKNTYVCLCVRRYMYSYIYSRLRVHTKTPTYTRMHTHIQTVICIFMHISIYKSLSLCIYIYIYIYIFAALPSTEEVMQKRIRRGWRNRPPGSLVAVRPTHNYTDRAESPARSLQKKPESPESQLLRTTSTYWPTDETHLGTMYADAGVLHSMSA